MSGADTRGPAAAQGSKRPVPVRVFLALLVAALVLPLLGFAAVVLERYSSAEQARNATAAQTMALRVADALDRELTGLQAGLLALATAPALQSGDVAAFDAQARLAAVALGENLVLSDTDGQQLVNTRVAPGGQLPKVGEIAPYRAAVERRAPVVSDLFVGAVSHTPLIVVNVPVLRGGSPAYVLNMSLPTTRLTGILRAQNIPQAWVGTVVDGGYRIITRSRDEERFLGQLATADLRAATTGAQGTWDGMTADGTPVLGAYAKLRSADWRVAVGVPVAVLEAPLRRGTLLLTLAGLATVGLTSLLAVWMSRRLLQSLHGLAHAARQLGRGEPPAAAHSAIREVDEVSAALSGAAEELARFAGDLERQVSARTAELAQANDRLREEIATRAGVEEQLRQAQKMEAVGRLTGGIAHDFNNLLTIVIGSLDLLRRRLPAEGTDAARQRRLVDGAVEGAQRATTLTARLLAFSRQQPLSPKPLDLNRLVSGMGELLRRTLGEQFELETVLSGGLWQAHADPNQLESALLNLAVNARDAMQERDPDGIQGVGGKLTVETGNVYLDEAYARANQEVVPGQYVMLAVTDTGQGMVPDVIARAFDPFFTTKPQGKGTGLGLSQVHGFVKQSGGHVQIYSETRPGPGQGTTVRIYLPRFVAQKAEAALPDQPAPGGGQGELVLLVEDEEAVRRYSAAALAELGYRVLEADRPARALRLLDANPDVAVLFTDVVLPEGNGRKLAEEARARRPGLPVLFTTGYTRNAIVHNGQLDAGVDLVTKPYTLDVLAAKLREVLDRPDPALAATAAPSPGS